VAAMSRLVPRPQLGDRGLGPAWAARPARTPQLQGRAGETSGWHCAGRLVPPPLGLPQPTSSPATWLYWFHFQQVPKRSGDAASLQPSAARLGGRDPSPLPPAGCSSWGRCPRPRWVAWAGSKREQGDAEPSVGGCGGQLTVSLHPQPAPRLGAGRRDGPRGSERCRRPAVRKSIHFITDPRSARGSVGRTSLTWDVSIFQQGEEKRGTNPTDPTHGSLVLENRRRCGREKLWLRGAPAETRGDTSAIHHHPPRDACEEPATHLETHKRQMHFAARPSLHLPRAAGDPHPPPSVPTMVQHPFCSEGERVPVGISD